MTEAERAMIADHPVLLYDGVCALCNGVVRFVLRHDHDGLFRLAPLQSPVAHELLGAQAVLEEGVAVVIRPMTAQQRVLRRSEAVAEVLRLLSYRRTAQLLSALPLWLREAGYGIVARIRYRLFGRYTVCPLPPVEARGRFLGL